MIIRREVYTEGQEKRKEGPTKIPSPSKRRKKEESMQ